MNSSTHTSGTDDNAVTAEVPGWEAYAGGVGLFIEGQVRRRNVASSGVQSQVICYFSRLTAPNYEDARFIIRQPFDHFTDRDTWEEATRQMLSTVAADHVRPADLQLLAIAFSMYTFSVLDRFSIAELAKVEIATVIKVPAAPTTSSSHLLILVPMEEYRNLSSGGDDPDLDMESDGGPCRPASAAAVEDLRMVTPEEPGSCSICLDDFDAATRVLAMPCRHLFHEVCLKEWLLQSNSCPLCRFSLPVAAE
ncbi:hypothetical protein ZIOFF_053332 [Zingiber officinale]|uniref:RING-type domain-containing protein n=1 Tax=Zingiber officinale TaxID=94328 RepID=A0A8J5FIJ4_ZINOF|nr:hypothetical protein ZIOFF_053332 [Zingiber officinale]